MHATRNAARSAGAAGACLSPPARRRRFGLGAKNLGLVGYFRALSKGSPSPPTFAGGGRLGCPHGGGSAARAPRGCGWILPTVAGIGTSVWCARRGNCCSCCAGAGWCGRRGCALASRMAAGPAPCARGSAARAVAPQGRCRHCGAGWPTIAAPFSRMRTVGCRGTPLPRRAAAAPCRSTRSACRTSRWARLPALPTWKAWSSEEGLSRVPRLQPRRAWRLAGGPVLEAVGWRRAKRAAGARSCSAAAGGGCGGGRGAADPPRTEGAQMLTPTTRPSWRSIRPTWGSCASTPRRWRARVRSASATQRMC